MTEAEMCEMIERIEGVIGVTSQTHLITNIRIDTNGEVLLDDDLLDRLLDVEIEIEKCLSDEQRIEFSYF